MSDTPRTPKLCPVCGRVVVSHMTPDLESCARKLAEGDTIDARDARRQLLIKQLEGGSR
jgi:hypothetical protein